MGLLQKLIISIVPRRWAEALEAESRAWRMRCPCGHEVSIWEIGGIRYKAVGNPKRLYRCPHCGLTWHTVYKRSPESGPQ